MAETLQTTRMAQVRRVLWIVLVLNVVVALAKFFYGLFTHSASMQADGIHSIFDSAGNIVGLVGITLALRPADERHPYGHFKFETYASVIIGFLLLFAAVEVGYSAISSLLSHTHEVVVTPFSFGVMVGTLIINIGVTRYERREGKRLNSEVLLADASHTLSDAMVSIGVIIGLVLVKLGFGIADSIMALVVMVAILFTAYGVFKSALETLSDEARIPEADIRAVVEALPEVASTHRIRTRGTAGDVYADLHVLVDPAMTVADAHVLADRIEADITQAFPQVKDILVHIEPDDEEQRAEGREE